MSRGPSEQAAVTISRWCLFWLAWVAAASVLVFPGRTYLHSDTQIYVPLFEHLENTALLQRELIVEGAHLSYTLYDEVTLALRKLSGLDWEWVLLAQQLFFRFVGAVGALLLARSAGLSERASIFVSGVVWLGAFVYGPAVNTTEYEPVPRGFAVPLVVFALGARAAGWKWWSGLGLGAALLYHAPAIWPVLLVALWKRDRFLLGPVAAAGVLLFTAAKMQPGVIDAQPFFSLLDEAQRAIQRVRAPYNWTDLWLARYYWAFALTGGMSWWAWRRLREELPESVRLYFVAIPALGFATVPLSMWLLDGLGWALFPQVQPMRALLYCHLFCQWLGAVAAALCIRESRWKEAAGWLIVPLSLSLRGDLLHIDGRDAALQLALIAALGAGCWWAARTREPRWALALLGVPFLFAWLGDGAAATLETRDLRATAEWAQKQSAVEAVFFFPDLGRRLEPGIFRARAARAVYVCWKQGGQVNYFPKYASIWWERWTRLLAPGHADYDYGELRRRGVDYVVLTKEPPMEGLPAEYVSPDQTYRVYRLH